MFESTWISLIYGIDPNEQKINLKIKFYKLISIFWTFYYRLIFDILTDTTDKAKALDSRELWFAFKIYIFGFLIQQDVYYLQNIKDLQEKSENKKCWSENKKSRSETGFFVCI